MALRAVSPEMLQEMCTVIGVPCLNRPHAAQVDSGDCGTVFIYIPLLPAEYEILPSKLKSAVFCFGKSRFGVVVHVSPNFELLEKDKVNGVAAVYDGMNVLREMSYTTENHASPRVIKDSARRDQLLEHAKKKKIPVKITVRA